MKEHVLLVGFGDIASRLQQQLPSHYQSTGLRRSHSAAAGMIQGDIADATQAKAIMARGFDVVVVTLTPDHVTAEGYEQAYVQTVRNLLHAISAATVKPRLLLWVSSTSVYGQGDGEWVDEDTLAQPPSFSGAALLRAEELLGEADIATVAVRCSGIYGPGRQRLIEQVREGKGCSEEPVQWTNRIHADDVAGVLLHLMEQHRQGASLHNCYLATDCEPVSLWDIKHWLATTMGFPPEHLVSNFPAGRRGSKRCSNQRLLDSGYHFKYPTYREGYRHVLDHYAEDPREERRQ